MAQKYAKDQPAGFTNRIERVAIVGASGSVGKPIAEELLKTGKHTITALTRAGSTNVLPAGIRSVAVDYDDEASLVAALQNQQFLIITLAARAPPESHHKLVTAAAKAGVPYVMPNCYGFLIADEAVRKEMLVAPQYHASVADIEAQGVSSWIALANSFWYEFSLGMSPDSYGFDIPARKATFYGDGTVKLSTTTWQQCGRAVAALLSLPELPADENDQAVTLSRWRNDQVSISDFYVSQRDMLDSLHRVLGTTDGDWTITYEPVEERYRKGLVDMKAGNLGGYRRAMYARGFYPDFKDHVSADQAVNDLLGLPKEDLDAATKRAIALSENEIGEATKARYKMVR
ncbi:putative oxidoreductase CipA [Podospora appendiculata]|uniref:Oxidoreductase CipA n=1 Tax=Podospora appendiculata TaxID=314037 RepID=A0AAE1CA67_9PEZI|nr:putative oxidoreductase CipA [Podospora appendiculata]